jgi:hypothetical protein
VWHIENLQGVAGGDDEIHVNVTRVVIVMCLTNFTASFCFTVSRGMAGARSGPDPSIPLGREALRYAALAPCCGM